jgi:hypothetical protein
MNARNTVPGSLLIREKFNLANSSNVQDVVVAICYACIKSDISFITDDLHVEKYQSRAIERNSDIRIHNV